MYLGGFYRLAKMELSTLSRMKYKMEKEYASLPAGSLKVVRSRGHSYLRCIIDGESRYLSMKKSEDVELARGLRRRRYLKDLLKSVNNNIDVIGRLLKSYKIVDPKAVSDRLSQAYQIPPGREREVLPGFCPQKSSEMNVRSKSERVIALILELEGYDAQYEREILLEGRVFKPDFTIRHPQTNELIYYEHFGLIDDPRYYRNMLEKLMIYWKAGIRLGVNLIVTFETKDHPLTEAAVRNALDNFFDN